MPTTARHDAMPQPVKGGGPALARLRDRFGHLVHELGRFGTVGAVAFAVDAALFNYLTSGHLESLTAKACSTAVAATVAFVGNRFWTWRHRERSGLAREYLLFFFFNAVGLGIGVACLALGHYGLGSVWPFFQSRLSDNIFGLLIGTAFGTLFRFWAYRRFVFVATAHVPAETAGGATQVDPLGSASSARTNDRSG